MIRSSVLLSVLFLFACNTYKPLSKSSPEKELRTVESYAMEKFGDNYFVVSNSSNEYSLVKSKTKTFSEIGFDISFFIFENSTSKVLVEDFLKSGYVDWIDEVTIKAVNRKLIEGNKRKKEVYVFNASTLEKKYLQ